MCMGCGATLIETSDGKNADSLENIFWLGIFALVIGVKSREAPFAQ